MGKLGETSAGIGHGGGSCGGGRAAPPRGPEKMDGDVEGRQLEAEPALEAEGEVRRHGGRDPPMAREGSQHRLEAAVQVSHPDVEDTHDSRQYPRRGHRGKTKTG
jgi:hypothetical protein